MKTITDLAKDHEYIHARGKDVSIFYWNEGKLYKYRVYNNGIEHVYASLRDIPTDAIVVPTGTYKTTSKPVTTIMEKYVDESVKKYGTVNKA